MNDGSALSADEMEFALEQMAGGALPQAEMALLDAAARTRRGRRGSDGRRASAAVTDDAVEAPEGAIDIVGTGATGITLITFHVRSFRCRRRGAESTKHGNARCRHFLGASDVLAPSASS